MVYGCKMTSEDVKNTKGRIHKAWKSRFLMFINTPLPHARKKVHIRSGDGSTQLGQSLEKLLTDEYGITAFHDFLKSQFCEENLEFWRACEEFKSISSPEKLVCRATSIYKEFIENDSPKEVNVDFHTRETIGQNLHWPTTSCFDGAQRKVYSLMENDSYPRFIQSDFFKKLCADIRASGKPRRA
ncbi:hypothetical protein DPEC_G00055940 [Dallia pectoralis]|uniref:Uncharacterized protein n=1 Tax=Dallia pectoralis TaxID=75939 RepID=A0ACC2H5M6_DALPE|nr:hypothetical protein DPEC_G00055940 [Dallia pectoralis]